MGSAVKGVNNNLFFKPGLKSIQSGEIFTVKIISNKDGLIKASFKGRVLSVRGDAGLIPGQTVRVRAEWSGRTLYLKQLSDNSQLKSLIQESGIKPDRNSVMMFQAAGDAGLAIKEDTVRYLKKFIRGRKEISREEARTAAELIKKGIDPDSIISVLNHRERPDEKRGRDETLLFNHLQDRDDLWFIVPISFSAGKTIQGSLRFSRKTATGKIDTVIIETEIQVNAGDNEQPVRILFVIDNFSSKKRKMHLISDGNINESLEKRIKNGMNEILSNLAFKFDDNINVKRGEGLIFDGFGLVQETAAGIEEIV